MALKEGVESALYAADDDDHEILLKTSLGKYLDFYRGLESPGHAVLVVGDWGVGKTTQVLKILPKHEVYYVSLFGLATVDDIYLSVYAAMHPIKGGFRQKIKKVQSLEVGFGGATVDLAGLANGVASVFARDQAKTDRVIVFDDLERSTVDLRDTLGVINRYVEHHECKVVVIAHDEKLTSELQAMKEKIFGQTIRAVPQVRSAFRVFCNNELEEFSERIFIYEGLILDLFKASGVMSLRVMRHVISDLARLYSCLSTDYLKNYEVVHDLTSLFVAICIEVRAGNLTRQSVLSRQPARQWRRASKTEGATDATDIFEDVASKYSGLDIGSDLLSSSFLVTALYDGYFDSDELNRSVASSHYFIQPEVEPAWRIFINFDRLPDDAVDKAQLELLRQFECREITNVGEMQHLFSLRFLMAQEEIISQTPGEVLDACKAYVDDLYTQRRLDGCAGDAHWNDEFFRSYGGIGYWVGKEFKVEFDELVEYLLSRRRQVHRDSYPKIAEEILRALESDASEFQNMVSDDYQGIGRYSSIDVLSVIDPERFVGLWEKADPESMHTIQIALELRYKTGLLPRQLRSEADWLNRVIELMEKSLSSLSGMRRLRRSRAIPRLKNIIEDALQTPLGSADPS